MVGVDIIEVDRIAKGIEKHGRKFIEKLFTPNEIAYCENHVNKLQRYAARFAIKEAVAKVIKKGPKPYWQDIAVTNRKDGSPEVILSERLLKIFPHPISISISHVKDYAVGMAVAYPK